MPSFGPHRIAVLGCGLWGRNLVRELVAVGIAPQVADPCAAAREEAIRLGAAGVSEDVDRLDGVDAYFVATPASTHADVVLRLAAEDKPIFLEKPMALALPDAQRMAEAAGPRLFVLHVWRYHPAIRTMAKRLAAGAVGRPTWIASRRLNWTSPRTDCDPVWTLLPHDLSIFLELTGSLPPARTAFAEPGPDGPVGMVAHLGGDIGMVAEVSTRSARKIRDVRVGGDAGVLVMEADEPVFRVFRGRPGEVGFEEEEITLDGPTALQAEVWTCLAHLEGMATPRSGIEDALLIQTRMHELRALAGLDGEASA